MEITAPWVYFISLLSLVVGFAVRSFLAPYVGERAKNLATHHDLEKLTNQVEATTAAAKRIEARIADEVWNRQRHWELKREVLLDAAKRLAEADDALHSMSVVRGAPEPDSQAGQIAVEERKLETTTRWKTAAQALDETRLTVAIVCDRKTQEAFDVFATACHNIAAGITGDPHSYERSHKDLYLKLLNARNRIREELGIRSMEKDEPDVKSGIAGGTKPE